MNRVYKVFWKIYWKKDKKLAAYILDEDSPLMIKSRGRWWIYFGTIGFQRSHFNFEECKEYVIIELKKYGNELEVPGRVLMGYGLDQIKEIGSLLE